MLLPPLLATTTTTGLLSTSALVLRPEDDVALKWLMLKVAMGDMHARIKAYKPTPPPPPPPHNKGKPASQPAALVFSVRSHDQEGSTDHASSTDSDWLTMDGWCMCMYACRLRWSPCPWR